MEITTLGYILIPAIVATACIRREWLLYQAVLFSPLQASAVLNFPSITFGLQPSHLAGSLWIGLCIMTILMKAVVKTPVTEVRQVLKGIWMFGAWAGITALLMPLLFEGKVQVLTPEGEIAWLAPMRLNLTQSLYLLWGIAFCTMIVIQSSMRQTRNLLIVTLLAGVLTVAFGVYQLYSWRFGWPVFETILFNNCGFSQGFRQTVGPIKRVSSFFTEPSVYTSFISGFTGTVLVLYFGAHNRGSIKERWKRFFLFFSVPLAFIGLILSTSTTAFAVGAMLLCGTMLYFGSRLELRKIFLLGAFTFVSVAACWLIWLSVTRESESLTSTMSSLTIDKTKTSSGIERLSWDGMGIRVFIDTYGLGAGWGSNRASSLLITIASTTGVLGIFIFIWTLLVGFSLVKTVKRWSISRSDTGLLVIVVAASIGLLGVLLAGIIAVPDLYFVHFWAFAGLMLSAANVALAGNTKFPR